MVETPREAQLRVTNRILLILLIAMTFAMAYSHAMYQEAKKVCAVPAATTGK